MMTSVSERITNFIFLFLFQAETLDGTILTTEVFYKNGQDYQFLCHGKDQTGEGCQNYRVRFLCGSSGTCPMSESQTLLLLCPLGWLFGGRSRSSPRKKSHMSLDIRNKMSSPLSAWLKVDDVGVTQTNKMQKRCLPMTDFCSM